MRLGSLRLGESDRNHLVVAAAALGVEVVPNAVEDLVRFADVLDVWSRKTNLISCRSARELLDRHILDSLAVEPVIPECGTIIDLGSGAGFPGIPLAITRPQQRFVLVEPRQKRASFLAEVKRTLSLANTEILMARAESPPPARRGQAALVVSRAVWSGEALLPIAEEWLTAEGVVIRMRSEEQPAWCGSGGRFVLDRSIEYQIGGGRSHFLDILRRDGRNVSRETSPG